jgi:LysR family transcriptional regulator, transcriptional activator for aaeXAB operon
MSLTSAGEHFLQSCSAITEEWNHAQQRMQAFKNEPEGLLRVTCSVNLGIRHIAQTVSTFQKRYNRVSIDLILSDQVVDIIQDGIDLAIRGGQLHDSGLIAKKLGTYQYTLCASPAYLNDNGHPTTIESLAAHEWVMHTQLDSRIQLTRADQAYVITPRSTMRTNNAVTRKLFALQGHGIIRLPHYDALPLIEQGQLVPVLAEYDAGKLDVHAVFARGATDNRALRLLIDFLSQCFEQEFR